MRSLKILFVLVSFISIVFAQTIDIKKNGKVKTYTIEDEGDYYILNKKSPKVYYFSSSSKLLIKFDDDIDADSIQEIESDYELTFSKALSNGKYVYEVEDVIETCNTLSSLDSITEVTPIVNSKVKLH